MNPYTNNYTYLTSIYLDLPLTEPVSDEGLDVNVEFKVLHVTEYVIEFALRYYVDGKKVAIGNALINNNFNATLEDMGEHNIDFESLSQEAENIFFTIHREGGIEEE